MIEIASETARDSVFDILKQYCGDRLSGVSFDLYSAQTYEPLVRAVLAVANAYGSHIDPALGARAANTAKALAAPADGGNTTAPKSKEE